MRPRLYQGSVRVADGVGADRLSFIQDRISMVDHEGDFTSLCPKGEYYVGTHDYSEQTLGR